MLRPDRAAVGVRAVLAAFVLAATCLVLVAVPKAAAAVTVPTDRVKGDLTMDDGVTLRYTVVKPTGGGTLPTLFEYSGYDPGNNPDPGYISQYVTNGSGYNYIGVNLRGTGCSSGTFDFFQHQEALDAVKVIAWITAQPWSDGKVAMIGKSYPGITQLFVAEQRPPGLVAIAPGHFFGDAYRDIARPGGVQNYGFASLWSFVGRPSYEFESGTEQAAMGDAECTNGTDAELRSSPTNPFVQLQEHPYDDAIYPDRSPDTHLDRIQVPMLATLAWQDEELDSRGTDLLARLDDLNATRRGAGQPETPWWATLSNGDHDIARTATEYADLHRFYDHVVKGVDNGWGSRPKVQVWWDADATTRAPAWISGLDHWSEAQRTAAGTLHPEVLNLRDGGGLTAAPAGLVEPAESYQYVPGVGSQGISNPYYGDHVGPSRYLWDASPPPGTALAWTGAPVAADTTLLGSASLDLWLASTAPDTDLQVTLTEVRPDGQEMYLQKGWLKASQRKLDPARSTVLRPYQTHTQADVADLQPLVPVAARVEIFPFGALIRKGSALRVWVEAPTEIPELWAFPDYPVNATNTVLHDAAHPSRLVLPVVPNDANRVEAYAACTSLIREPCRTDPKPSNSAAYVPVLNADPAAPVATVPEAPAAVLLPLGAAGAVVLLVGRRRRRSGA